jgi:signal transduction histidine kinase
MVLCNDAAMTQARASVALAAWPAIIATGLFVTVTHYVSIAAGAPFEFLVIDTSLALLFLVAGAIAWQRRPTSRTGPILVLSAALWSLGSYGPTFIEPVWALGFAFEGYYDVALALLALTFPAIALDGRGRVLMAVLLSAFAVRSAGRLLLADPPRTFPEAFPDGPTNPFAIFESRTAFEIVEVSTSVVVLVAVIAVAFLSVRRLAGSHALTRAVVGPVMLASVVAMGFAAVEATDTAWATAFGASLLTIPDEIRAVTDWLAPVGRAVVPLAFLVGTLRLRSRHGPLPMIAAQLERGEGPEDVDAALAAYIENRELAALLTSQLAELRASRARLVTAGDAERRRIERALHDGAQQHLTGIAIKLEEARRTPGIGPDALVRKLDDTVAELRDAINELRELARGIHPTILTEAGLEPALATLARRSPVPVDLRVDLDGHLPLPTEVTAYYVVAEGLTNVARSARASRAEVTVERRADGLTVGVRDDGIGGADPAAGSGIAGLRDRVRALNGRFRLDSPVGRGTELEVWLPCE